MDTPNPIIPLKKAPKRISPKEAAQEALKYFIDLTGNSNGTALEEIELSDDGQTWNLTLSSSESSPFMYSSITGGVSKSYKAFVVDAFTGEILSMKIRKV